MVGIGDNSSNTLDFIARDHKFFTHAEKNIDYPIIYFGYPIIRLSELTRLKKCLRYRERVHVSFITPFLD